MSDLNTLVHDTLFEQYKRTLTTFTAQILGPPSTSNDDMMLAVLAEVIAAVSAETGRPLLDTFVTNLIDHQE